MWGSNHVAPDGLSATIDGLPHCTFHHNGRIVDGRSGEDVRILTPPESMAAEWLQGGAPPLGEALDPRFPRVTICAPLELLIRGAFCGPPPPEVPRHIMVVEEHGGGARNYA